MTDQTPQPSPVSAYRVLARKYRPLTFADLIGQEAMVRTLRNAFAADRIAHAFMLTGVRGVGKTTTARIIAKGLNCLGPQGQNGPTTEPCGTCEPCLAIADGRHVDVLEMDAASRTGVGDIRELIDGVAYRAASARYKVYIIDEVHMLSTSAFNALLKTLEEPPEHVKFLFATTEIRKVPVTVLSRCQRFDLRRIEPEAMMAHLTGIADQEAVSVSDDALGLIVRAAEGSVRDALSLLDQAIAHGTEDVDAQTVREMLGLADRGRVFDLFERVMAGDVRGALEELSAQYAAGADPSMILRDLAEVTHWISMVRIAPESADDPTTGPDERARGLDFAARLEMRDLTRMWQMLLRALEEIATAPNVMMAAEMAIIRLTHAADLPGPEELVRRLTESSVPTDGRRDTNASANGPSAVGDRAMLAVPEPRQQRGARPSSVGAAASPEARMAVSEPEAVEAPVPTALARYQSFEDVIALVRARRDMPLLVEIEAGVGLIEYLPGRIVFAPAEGAAADLADRIAERLRNWTGVRWEVSAQSGPAEQTIAARRSVEQDQLRAGATAHPVVSAMLEAFPGAKLGAVRTPEMLAAGLSDEEAELAPPAVDADEVGLEVSDDWDPFDEEN